MRSELSSQRQLSAAVSVLNPQASGAQGYSGLRVFGVRGHSKGEGHTTPDTTMTHISSETPRSKDLGP